MRRANFTLFDLQLDAHILIYLHIKVTIPEAADIQLRRRPSEDEQGNTRNV